MFTFLLSSLNKTLQQHPVQSVMNWNVTITLPYQCITSLAQSILPWCCDNSCRRYAKIYVKCDCFKWCKMRKRRDIRAYRCKIYACRILQLLVSRGLTIGISWILYNKCIIDSLCSTIHHNILWMEYIHIKDSKSYCIIFSNDFGTKTYCLPQSPQSFRVCRHPVDRAHRLAGVHHHRKRLHAQCFHWSF